MIATKIERYGEDYAKVLWAKGRKTYEERTGYSHPIYNIETHYKRARTRSKIAAKDGKSFDSYYETRVYDSIVDITNVNTQIPVEYQYQNKQHTTWIDFKLNDRLFEVKGGHLIAGVYDSVGIPIETKLKVYNDNNVIVVTNNASSVKEILNQYPNIIGIDINLFNPELPVQDRIDLWNKILEAISQGIKFIDNIKIKHPPI